MDLIKIFLEIKSNVKFKDDYDDNKLLQLERELTGNINATENELCNYLYKDVEHINSLRLLKSRLKEKLIKDLFLLCGDKSHDDIYNYKSLIADRNFTVGSMLYKYGYKSPSIYFLEETFNYSCDNTLTSTALSCCKILMEHYSFVDVNRKKMNFFIEKNDELLKTLIVERNVAKYNAIISNLFISKKGNMNKVELENLKSMIDEIYVMNNNNFSRTINFLSTSLICFYHNLVGQYEDCIEQAQKGIDLAVKKYPDDKQFYYRCKMDISLSHFYLNKFEIAEQEIKDAIAIAPVGNRLWLHDHGYLFTILIRQKKYNELFHLVQKIKSTKELKNYKLIEEEWKLREAFVHLLLNLNLLSIQKDEILSKFNIGKFLNDMNFYSKDKIGYNINIIALKIIFYILEDKKDRIIDNMDSLTQYNFKYLRKDETIRANCFIKMLIKLIKYNYSKSRVIKETEELNSMLLQNSFKLDEKNNMVEIIPYEVLWDLILEVI